MQFLFSFLSAVRSVPLSIGFVVGLRFATMTTRQKIGVAGFFLPFYCGPQLVTGFTAGPSGGSRVRRDSVAPVTSYKLYGSNNFYNDFGDSAFGQSENNDDEEDDDYIDTEQLGDWRTFRMNLAETGSPTDKKSSVAPRKSVSKENEALLRTQSKLLADEYEKGIWAHDTAKVCNIKTGSLYDNCGCGSS